MTRSVLAAVDDMFFAAKIRAVAEAVGVKVDFARSNQKLIDAAQTVRPSLIIVDLHSEKVAAEELARQLKADTQLRGIPLLGFFSHVQTELKIQAEAAGFDRVMPRSAFAAKLADVLRGDE
jgi:PleD family two-component response regulator